MTLVKLQSISLSGSCPITDEKAQFGLSNKTGAGLPPYIAGEIGNAPGRKKYRSALYLFYVVVYTITLKHKTILLYQGIRTTWLEPQLTASNSCI